MQKFIPLIVPSLLLFMIPGCKAKSEGRFLKFNLEKGKTYDYDLVMDMDQEVMGQKNKIGLVADYMITVVQDDGVLKTLDVTYRDFKMNMNLMGQLINIDASVNSDSAQKDEMLGMMQRAFAGILGKKFTMKVKEDGSIEAITGLEEIVQNLVSTLATSEEMRMAVSASLNDQFSDNKIKETFTPLFSVYPNKQVGVGDKWSSEYDISSQGTHNNSEYTVKSLQGDNVVIDVHSKISPSDHPANPAMADIKMNGTSKGTMTINSKSGLIVDAEINQELETSGSVNMKILGKTKMQGKERS